GPASSLNSNEYASLVLAVTTTRSGSRERCRRRYSAAIARRAAISPSGCGAYNNPRGFANGARRSCGYSKPARVGFDSVRSMIGWPSLRRRRTASVNRFGARLPQVRRENTSPSPPQVARRGCIFQHLARQIHRIRDPDVCDFAGRIFHGLQPGHHKTGVRRQLQFVDTTDHFITHFRIEVDAGGFEQLFRRGIITLRLDPLNLGKQVTDPLVKDVAISQNVIRLPVTAPD